jgi:hypothetical protein
MMVPLVVSIAKNSSIGFIVMVCISFTPLVWLPHIFVLPLLGGGSVFILMLFIAGAPFGGVLFTFLCSPKGKRLSNAAGLAGVWLGTISGSWIGLKLVGGV